MFTDTYRGRGVSHFMCMYALTLSLFMFCHVFHVFILHRYLQTLFYGIVIVVVTVT